MRDAALIQALVNSAARWAAKTSHNIGLCRTTGPVGPGQEVARRRPTQVWRKPTHRGERGLVYAAAHKSTRLDLNVHFVSRCFFFSQKSDLSQSKGERAFLRKIEL